MAEVTIRLRHNPRTGEREVVIHYESDTDALPHEHERDHRALAEQLLGQPLDQLLGAASVDRVVVERAPKAGAEAQPEAEAPRTPEAQRNRG
ncbi:MAG: hypothetical protein R3B09_22280 [Nannocystaceae bacterium]